MTILLRVWSIMSNSPLTTITTEDEDAWIDGDTALTSGDCYIEIGTGDEARLEEVPCDEPHLGEAMATGWATCPAGIDRDEFTAIFTDYTGVDEDAMADWMDRHGVTGSARMGTDASGRVDRTMCSLVAEEGELTGSYRAD